MWTACGEVRGRRWRLLSFLGATVVCTVMLSHATLAKYALIYSFCSQTNCADGKGPVSTLTPDGQGNVYGMADDTSYCNCYGEVFQLTSSHQLNVLHHAAVPEESVLYAEGPLTRGSGGILYGLSPYGGVNGYGALFEILSGGSEKVLYSFCSRQNCADGANPNGGLIRDASGNFYGAAFAGGAHGNGAVFEFTSGGALRLLYSFDGQGGPNGSLVRDTHGKLYGTTNTAGTVFEITIRSRTAMVLHQNLNQPTAGLLRSSSGLYGTTSAGGTDGGGTVFLLYPASDDFTVLHNFCSRTNCADGQMPTVGSLVEDGSGHFFGLTYAGGANGKGAVYDLDLNRPGLEVLHSFCSQPNCADGWGPLAGLAIMPDRSLVGTVPYGGANSAGGIFQL